VSASSGRNGTFTSGSIGPTFRAVAVGKGLSTLTEVALRQSGVMTPSAWYVQLGNTPISTSASQTVSMNLDFRPVSFWQHHLTLGQSQTDFGLVSGAPQFRGFGDTLLTSVRATGRRTTAGYNMTLTAQPWRPFSSTLTLGANGSKGYGYQLGGSTPTRASVYFNNVSATQTIGAESYGGFSQWQLGVADRFFLTLGLRGERNPSYGNKHKIDWTPTNGATYTVEHGDLTLKLLGSYGRATRPPNPDMRRHVVYLDPNFDPASYAGQLANPDLTPEYSRGPQGGLELYYGNLLSLTVNHYSQRVTDLIQGVTVDSILRVRRSDGAQIYYGQGQYRNVANMRQVGWESSASVNFGVVSVRGAYSWTDSRVTPRVGVPSTFTWLPTHTGSVGLDYARGGTTIALNTSYVGKSVQALAFTSIDQMMNVYGLARLPEYLPRRVYVATSVGDPGYAKSDLVATHRLNRAVTATLNVMNLTNSFQSDASMINPTLGRQTTFGLSLRYP
jgi:outer membrane receptor for ferrienterochelin and colicin